MDESRKSIQEAAEKILARHYSTIGIEDVFLEAPKHPLPLKYLNNTAETPAIPRSFMSLELVGSIKNSPEDFCVREIFQNNREIPGISKEDTQKMKVADLKPQDQLPQQHLPVMKKEVPSGLSEAPEKSLSESMIPPPSTAGNQEESAESSPLTIIESFLARVLKGEPNPGEAASSIISLFDNLHIIASDRIKRLASEELPASSTTDRVWIPPLILESDCSSSAALPLRETRGALHRALKSAYPLLASKSHVKDGNEHWILVEVDDSYDGLTKLLEFPVKDICALLAFQKQGFQGAHNENKKNRDYDNASSSLHLTLKGSISKDERRSIHHLIAEKCKYLATGTLSTAVIKVGWQKNMVQRAGRKRKLSSNDNGYTSNPFPNILVVLKKRQKEHLTALQRLTRAVHCRQSDVGVAGIKDLQAVTYQFCTLRDTKFQRIQSAKTELEKCGIELGNFFQVDWVLNNGDLDGNQFEIIVRDLRRISVQLQEWGPAKECLVESEAAHIKRTVERLRSTGFINFFGEQRVGSAGKTEDVGVRAFDIGRAMLQQNFSQAIDLLMTGRTNSRESDSAKRVRKTWEETSGDPVESLKAFQGADIMARERIVLKGLNRYGKDRPLDALKCLSHSMRMFWTNAYQSFVWNKVASVRIMKYGANVIKGDLYQDENCSQVKVIKEENHLVSLSQVVLPLPGYNMQYPQNDLGDLYKYLLETDSVKFVKGAPLESTAKGSYRKLIVKPSELEFEMLGKDSVKLSFQLPKGCYATMCLRELMLTTATR